MAAQLHVNRECLGLCEPECVERDKAGCIHVVQEGVGGWGAGHGGWLQQQVAEPKGNAICSQAGLVGTDGGMTDEGMRFQVSTS